MFKVGDKVKIHHCEGSPRYNGKIGTMIETGRMKIIGHPRWDYLCSFEDLLNYPFGLAEMEKISEKGKQLEFAFMETI